MTILEDSTQQFEKIQEEFPPEKKVSLPPNTDAKTEALAPKPKWYRRWLRYVPLCLAVLVDTVLAVPAFNAVLDDSEVFSWLCAIGFSTLTVAVAFQSGVEARRDRKRLSVVLSSASLLLISAVCVLRLAAAAKNASSSVSYDGGSSTSDILGNEATLAIVMVLVMLAGSVAAWVDGYVNRLSIAATKISTSDSHLTHVDAEISECRSSIARIKGDLDYGTYQLDRIDRDLQEALSGLDAAILELQAHARFEIARLVGKPAATSGLDIPITQPSTNK